MLENLKQNQELAEKAKALFKDKNQRVVIALDSYRDTEIEDGGLDIGIVDASDFGFVGASHGSVMGPLFLLRRTDLSDSMRLDTYISYNVVKPERQKTIEQELTALAVAVSVFYPSVKYIELPKEIAIFSNSECKILSDSSGINLIINVSR